MVFVSSMMNYVLLVVMRVGQLLEHVFVSSMRNYVLSVVMRVEQLLEHCLHSCKSCFASRYES